MKPSGSSIPDKLYFRIGEVSDIVGVKPYVLRYWESEFQDIHPTKSKSGQRLYKRRDVEMLMSIKTLLYDERFTINGARKRLKELMRGDSVENSEIISESPASSRSPKPRQLEVFNSADPDSDEAELHSSRPSAEHRKIFLKLKKDLESMLHDLKV